MLKTIGEDLGEVMDMDITNQSAKVKVLLDDLQPLIKETMVDFPDGSEALVSLDYKNMKNHCFHCQRLTHEKKACPGLRKEIEESSKSKPSFQPAASKERVRNYYTPHNNYTAPLDTGSISKRFDSPNYAPSKSGRNTGSRKTRESNKSASKDCYHSGYRSSGVDSRRNFHPYRTLFREQRQEIPSKPL